MQTLCQALAVSRATAVRDLQYLRDRLDVPVVYDRDVGVYRIDGNVTDRIPLPGLWFSASEAHALLTMAHLLRGLDGGLLTEFVSPLEQRLRRLLDQGGFDSDAVLQRVRLASAGRRVPELRHFETAAHALLSRQRVRVVHLNRLRNETAERTLSPQRLTWYRDTWYLDAWCHLREDLRSFSLDALQSCERLDAPAHEVSADAVAERFDSGYGIFSHPSAARQWATLRFNAQRSRWAAHEQWHAEQRARWTEAGELVLEIPYHDPRELVGELLRMGGDCEVLAPDALRSAVRERVAALAALYPPAS